ncbi:hypothetical protein Sked_10820 [Sanguibacter keddieii DSM 10542]|uniref:Uncharacterized protein n=1 Tax=Sanguibacter keddieii (strain ATCC 51767 / DSM 10542 / NCFB 3025 / ST-74) TaxID=446469 RepID=D1BDG6_SANKS|nr:hypothetical protein [Sanguibacter keddieii]ACZ21028.1 hypothetical protein Sked_10820 [Sanguibacter keddieii DSM 10542]
MSTPETTRSKTALYLSLAALGAIVAVVSIWMLLRSNDSDTAQSMAKGVLQGGAVGAALGLLAIWRALRRPDKAKAGDRIAAGLADERDRSVWRRSTSILGTAALPLCGAAAVATGLGAPVDAVMAILLWTQLVLLVVSVAVIDRRS